jgi:site-specific recombinase XerC
MTSQTKIPQTLVGPLLQSFFMEHLCNHKRLSPQTVKSYRDTFRLLLQYLQTKMAKKPSALSIADLDAPVILRLYRHGSVSWTTVPRLSLFQMPAVLL